MSMTTRSCGAATPAMTAMGGAWGKRPPGSDPGFIVTTLPFRPQRIVLPIYRVFDSSRHDHSPHVQNYAHVDAVVAIETISAIMAEGELQVLATLSSPPHMKSEE